MARFTLTRSWATVTLAVSISTLFVVTVMAPLTSISGKTIGFTAMIVAGLTMLLRERVFTAPTRAVVTTIATPAPVRIINDWSVVHAADNALVGQR